MKFQLPSLKLLLKMLITLLILILVGFGLMLLVYTIPADNARKNVAASAQTFLNEEYYPTLDYPNSTIDSFTDATMLMEAAYDGKESVLQKAMDVPRNYVDMTGNDRPEDNLIARYVTMSESSVSRIAYSRYWHGYLVFLMPALCFLTYDQIGILNLILQILLSLTVIVLMIVKKSWQAIPAYIISIMMIHPLATAFCLQYATIFYIFTIFSILLLIFNNKLSISKDGIYIFFLVLGAVTAYLDFLTYPIATFCMVAVLYICLERNSKNHVDIRNILNILISWGLGYALMFASKWALASIFTNTNVVEDALNAALYRTSALVEDTIIPKGAVIGANLARFLITPITFAALILLVIEIIVLIISKSKFNGTMALSYLLVFILPLIWYCCLGNHSYLHSFFTYKSLCGSMFSLLCIFIAWDFPRKAPSTAKAKTVKKK